MESYNAIYDAVRSRLSNCDLGAAVESVVRRLWDISSLTLQLSNAIGNVECELVRPSVLFKPRLSLDGNAWCALLGDDLQSGIAAFGDSPEKAMRSFDVAWYHKSGG